MRLTSNPGVHLGYCTNIHPGETWQEVHDNLRRHLPAVKRRICPDRPLGIGLRLSAVAAESLDQSEALDAFQSFLARESLYVFTINGFPYGPFHGVPVKQNVYRPDWSEEARLLYSDRLARLLARLLPPGDEGTVSTVPGAFRPRADAGTQAAIVDHLLRHAATLVQLRRTHGVSVGLALEPEPHCMLETSVEAAEFFRSTLFGRPAVSRFAALADLPASEAEEALRHHVGVCLDACHAAVEFEAPDAAVDAFESAGIRILKMQVSTGLRVAAPTHEALVALERFSEGVYLHQTVVRQGDVLHRHLDLPDALSAARTGPTGDEWRVHFHVPLFQQRLGPFENTQPFLRSLLERQRRSPFTRHLEVETYTWDVLPEEYRRQDVDHAIARELGWTMDALGEPREGPSW